MAKSTEATSAGEGLLAKLICDILVHAEVELFRAMTPLERLALLAPGVEKVFDSAFDKYFALVREDLESGQGLAVTYKVLGQRLGHSPFCVVELVALACARLHRQLNRGRFRIETRKAYSKSMIAQLEPLAQKTARAIARNSHRCRKPFSPPKLPAFEISLKPPTA